MDKKQGFYIYSASKLTTPYTKLVWLLCARMVAKCSLTGYQLSLFIFPIPYELGMYTDFKWKKIQIPTKIFTKFSLHFTKIQPKTLTISSNRYRSPVCIKPYRVGILIKACYLTQNINVFTNSWAESIWRCDPNRLWNNIFFFFKQL